MKVKSFKEYLLRFEKDQEGNHILDTVFGKHSQKRKTERDQEGNHILDTVFGKHSQKKIEESNEANTEYDDLSHSKRWKIQNKLREHYKFDDDESEHIGEYTIDSRHLNTALRKKATLGHPIPPDLKKLSEGMHKVARKHKTPEDMHVYSGVKESPEHLIREQNGFANQTGSTSVTSHFTSTSLSKDMADGFALVDPNSEHSTEEGQSHHMIRIHVPKGTHGAYVNHHSSVPSEKEFVLPPGTKLHIHHVPTEEKDEYGHTRVIWHAKVKPHD